ncbi:MAG: (2Fe-2S)-binding protein [Conexivisphaerales archaeon]
MTAEGQDDSMKAGKISRRKFVIGVGAGVVVGAAAVAGAESYVLIKPSTSTNTSTVTSTVTGPTTTVTGPTTTKTSTATVTGPGSTSTVTSTVTGPTTTVTTTAAPPAPQPVSGSDVTMTVNGQSQTLYVESRDTLLDTLRDKLGLTGAKKACDRGECGACTVSIDGKPYLSCTTLAIDCDGRDVETIESFANNPNTVNILNAFVKNDAFQCGFCTAGMVVATKLLLDANPHPTTSQTKQWLSGNLCRCGTYNNTVKTALALGGGS